MNLLDATFAAQVDRLVSNHHFDWRSHAPERFIHHGTNFLSSDRGCIGSGRSCNRDLRSACSVLGRVGFDCVHTATATGIDGLSVYIDGDRLAHAAERFTTDGANLLACNGSDGKLLLTGRNGSDFRKFQWPTAYSRQADKLHFDFDLSSSDL